MPRRRRFFRRRKNRLPRRGSLVFILWCVVLIQGFFLLKYFLAKPHPAKDLSRAVGPYPRAVSGIKPPQPRIVAPMPPAPKVTPVPKVAVPKVAPPVVPVPPAVVKPRPQALIAIVIDDWGYSLKNASYLEEINQTLNLSILPHLPYSGYIAKLAHNKHFEVLLHMPMEPYPKENLNLEKDTILTSMDDSQIKDLLSKAIKSFPYIQGISNHMGSKATEDEHTVTVVLKELRRRRLYFLDSYTAKDPVSLSLAKKIKVKSGLRDVFLDNVEDYEYIRSRLYLLADVAKRQGFAIGIGHDKPATLRALRDILPVLEKKGFKFVRVSELVK